MTSEQITPAKDVGMTDLLDVKPSSEKRYGISKQPSETCPLIDAAMKAVQEAQEYTQRSDRDSEEELRERLWRIELALSELVQYRNQGILEDIRNNVSAIRNWGQEWKDLAKQYAPEDEEFSSSNSFIHRPAGFVPCYPTGRIIGGKSDLVA